MDVGFPAVGAGVLMGAWSRALMLWFGIARDHANERVKLGQAVKGADMAGFSDSMGVSSKGQINVVDTCRDRPTAHAGRTM